jgi:hypothetical protein
MDYSKPVNSLLNRFQKAGYKIVHVNDGEEQHLISKDLSNLNARKQASEFITSVDNSWVNLIKENQQVVLFIVLGNDPDEIVCDYTDNEEVESIVEAFEDQWVSHQTFNSLINLKNLIKVE